MDLKAGPDLPLKGSGFLEGSHGTPRISGKSRFLKYDNLAQFLGLWDPRLLPNGRTPWLINGGDPNYSITSKISPTYPWKIPRTLHQQFLKEFLSLWGLGRSGVPSQGMWAKSLITGMILQVVGYFSSGSFRLALSSQS